MGWRISKKTWFSLLFLFLFILFLQTSRVFKIENKELRTGDSSTLEANSEFSYQEDARIKRDPLTATTSQSNDTPSTVPSPTTSAKKKEAKQITVSPTKEAESKSASDEASGDLVSILPEFWLQLYDSHNKKDPTSWRNENFKFTPQNNPLFYMCGNSKRVELRHKKEWKIMGYARMEVNLRIYPLDAESFTFMQVLSYDKKSDGTKYYKPLLRLHWEKSYGGKINHIWATVRESLYESKFKKFDLGVYDNHFNMFAIEISNRKLKVFRNDKLKFSYEVKAWDDYMNYFKTGVYIQRGGCAKTEVRALKITIND